MELAGCGLSPVGDCPRFEGGRDLKDRSCFCIFSPIVRPSSTKSNAVQPPSSCPRPQLVSVSWPPVTSDISRIKYCGNEYFRLLNSHFINDFVACCFPWSSHD